MCLWSLLMIAAMGATPVEDRVNLVDFARVVRSEGDTPQTIALHDLTRGVDGWETCAGDDGQRTITVAWDEPRDIAEVNIEFRHAIADRHLIRVQYWQNHWPSAATGGWAAVDDPFHGRWVTARGEWWAGDRDVSFAFVPYSQERPGEGAPDVRYRRTFRLRFLCGERDLPPVRYLRAYGPGTCAQATFDVRLDDGSRLKPPLSVSALNGHLLEADGQTTMPAAYFDEAPCSMRVRYAEDDLDSPNRSVVTVRREHEPLEGLSFLPAEAVARGIIRVPSLGVVIAHRGSTQDLQAGLAPGRSVFDRVAAESEQTFDRARRDIPELVKSRHQGRMYLPLGVPDARQEIAVQYDGSILLEKSALKVRADDSERLRWPADTWVIRLTTGEPAFDHKAEGNIRQRLVDGWLPILVNTWEHQGIAYEQTCVAGLLQDNDAALRGDETVVIMSRLTMTACQPDARAVLRWNIEPPEVLALEDGHVLARGRAEGGKVECYDAPRYRFHVAGPQQGTFELVSGESQAATPALVWRGPVTRQASVICTVPFVTIETEAERRQIASLDFDALIEHESGRWRRLIAQAAPLETPEPLLNDFYKSQLTHILISADRDPYTGVHILPAATHGYGVCGNEACHQIRSLEIRGLHAEAARFLEAFLQGQSRWGLDGRFTDSEGVLYRVPTKDGRYEGCNYNLDHGFLLWMLNEHYRFTRDEAWLAERADAMIAACDFVTRQRTVRPRAGVLGADDERWGVGLLPAGHLEDPPEWLWWFAVNAYACRGMRMTAGSLAEIGHPQAGRIARDAESFANVLRVSCRESMVRAPVVRQRDGTYVPFQPTRSRLRGRDVGWIRDALYGPIHLIDCGIYSDDSPEAEWILRDAEDNVFIGEARGRRLDDFERQWFSWGGITLQSNLLPNPLIYLRRGQPRHAIRAFYNSLAANVYADVRTFCEHPVQAYGIGMGPFFKPPDESAFIVWLRHLLICEQGDTLDLLGAVPAGWLEPHRRIVMERAPTWFGPMSIRVESHDAPRRVVVELEGPSRNPPREMRLHMRVPRPMRSVSLNNEPTSSFDADTGVVTLPGRADKMRVVVTY